MTKCILVVEDHVDNRAIMRNLFSSAGYDVVEAVDGEEGVSAARKHVPDLILMDIQLPGMDGYDATRRIKADPELAHIPIIAVTSYALSGDEAKARDAGCDGYVTKPFSPRALLATVRQYIDQLPLVDGVMRSPARILVVDDNAENRDILETRLSAEGYEVITAGDGEEALRVTQQQKPDLLLLDVMMPKIDGIEVCRRLKTDSSLPFIPIIMVTAKSDRKDVITGLEAGGDDYVTKPIDHAGLVARVKSMLRIKFLHDTVQEQAAQLKLQSEQLAEWNRSLEQRVAEQVAELEKIGRVKRFVAPQVAELMVRAGSERFLESHRREISVVFLDLRGFTAFSETVEPEEVIGVIGEYHGAMGALIHEYEGTLERFTGDGIMVFFNDPLPCADPAARAVRMAVDMRERVKELARRWTMKGYDLGFGVGIAVGYATLGKVGFEGRFDYAAIGPVTNLAARLCDEAKAGQILVSQRVYAAVNELVATEPVGMLSLKGFRQPVQAYNVVGLRASIS